MRKVFYTISLLTLTVAMYNCIGKMKIKLLPYPQAIKEKVSDNYHGTDVADPYRWLEDDNSPQTAEWVIQENNVTNDYLSQIPFREDVKNRLTELWNYPKQNAPSKVGEYYFYFKNDGLQNQSILYYKLGVDGESQIFLDPNTLSEGGTVALVSVDFSEDNKYMAFAVSESGSDWVDIKVMEIATKTYLPDVIKWVKFSGASWSANSEGFYYSRYDEPAKGSELSGQNRDQKVYFHKLGDAQTEDKLIWRDESNPLRYYSAKESDNGKYLFITASEGTHGNEILYKNIKKRGSKFEVLFKGFTYNYSLITAKDDKAYVYTNEDAGNYKLASIDLTKPNGLSDIVPQNSNHLLEGVQYVGGEFVASYLENAMSSVYQYEIEGELIRKVELPGIGSVSGFSGKKEDVEVFYTINSYTAPATVYKYDLKSGESELYIKPEVKFNPDLFTTTQVFYPSKDGTKVSMFLVHKKDIVLNGENPVYLYGYGGFNINITPGFNPAAIMFMEQGGVYAVANLRGGGEYGEKWHTGGMLENKQNVFDDFISAAEYLIEKKYTSSDRLAIAGGSNGGLLVGACMVQRPDLFAVALPAVGVLDMLRFHKFTVGWGWVVEYGSSENVDQFDFLYKYSPLHNIEDGVCYPATLITTGDHDDRVVPAHSFKFAATLQAAQGCDTPTLIRIDTNAGHGAGKPTSKRIEEYTDVYSFMMYNTKTKVKFDR